MTESQNTAWRSTILSMQTTKERLDYVLLLNSVGRKSLICTIAWHLASLTYNS